ncbi:MAG: EamA family transporter [Promethearchaeota archaeon]
MADIIVLGLLFGVINTSLLHLAKGMERYGIEIFSKKKPFKEKGRKPLIYIMGLILNYLTPIWQTFGNTFASATVFSSVFGLGLIVLMLYSHYILKEETTNLELIGAILIIIGTTAVGILYIIEPSKTGVVNYFNFFLLLIVISILFSCLVGISWKKKVAIAFIFGAVAGALGGMDNVFKRMGLSSSNFLETFAGVFQLELPSILFVISFLLGLLAFLLTQIGFGKGADASKLVPMYNSMYIIAPILFEFIINRNATISILIILAVAIIVIGIFLMNLFKNKAISHESDKEIMK